MEKRNFDMLNLDSNNIQIVNLGSDKYYPIDPDKTARIYVDKGGDKYYWINYIPNRPIDKPSTLPETNKAENISIDSLLTIKEVKEMVDGFSNHFRLLLTYAIDPERNTKYYILDRKFYIDLPEILDQYAYGVLLQDSSNTKTVFLETRNNDSNQFLKNIKTFGIPYAVYRLIFNHRSKLRDGTIAEKIAFLKKYFIDYPNKSLDELPQYIPPRVKKPEHRKVPGSEVKYKDENTSLPTTDVKIDDKSLEEILTNPK
jgi:hypothetical protein